MMQLEVTKSDWETAVERITNNDPGFQWDKVEPDTICCNCVLVVAAERQFGKQSYYLDDLEIVGVGVFHGKRLHHFAARFDKHLQWGRLAPSKWPVVLELVPGPALVGGEA